MDALVTTDWLSEHLGEPDLVVLDCTVVTEMDEDAGGMHNVSGRAAYEAGHIPTAGFADLKSDLCTDDPVEFSLLTPEQFAAAMGALGVGDDTRVVLYDNAMSMWASRVWWMLRWVGFDRAALLDGGLGAWTGEDRALSTEPANHPQRILTADPRPELIADRREVLDAIEDDAVHLIDTLPANFYRGEAAMYGRPGHIPTAENICAMDLLDESGRFRPNDQIGSMHDSDPEARTITYCGGGIMASTSAFALVRLGFTDVAVYTASLQEWAADDDLPMVVEAD